MLLRAGRKPDLLFALHKADFTIEHRQSHPSVKYVYVRANPNEYMAVRLLRNFLSLKTLNINPDIRFVF